jgi:hypothetical protein
VKKKDHADGSNRQHQNSHRSLLDGCASFTPNTFKVR